ncbi:MAG: hypothetical protein ACRDWY_10660 [Actinomycetes bacterium]
MSSAWDRVHARYRLAADVLNRVARTGDPRAVERARDTIEDVFGSFGTFLMHLQRRWYTTLETRLDAALESSNGDADLPTLVAQVWTQMEAVDPGTRAVLDEYADHPDLRAGEARQRRILGVTGVGARGRGVLRSPHDQRRTQPWGRGVGDGSDERAGQGPRSAASADATKPIEYPQPIYDKATGRESVPRGQPSRRRRLREPARTL